MKIVECTELIVKYGDDMVLINITLTRDQLLDVRLNIFHDYEAVMESISVYRLFFLLKRGLIYINIQLDLIGHHLTKIIWRCITMVRVFTLEIRSSSSNSLFIENDINDSGSVNVLRHLIELPQQKDFSEELSAGVGSVKCVQNEFDGHNGTSRLLCSFDDLPKRAFTDLLMNGVIII